MYIISIETESKPSIQSSYRVKTSCAFAGKACEPKTYSRSLPTRIRPAWTLGEVTRVVEAPIEPQP